MVGQTIRMVMKYQTETPANNNRNQNKKLDRVGCITKTLRYNGNENWKSFKQKFMRYAQVKNWTADESKKFPMTK